jgi:hypothetical protein
MKISAYRSPDSRLRTDNYKKDESECFSIAETLMSGALVTEFKDTGEVINQIYFTKKDVKDAISIYLGNTVIIDFVDVQAYTPVTVGIPCSKCGADAIARSLDGQDTTKTRDVSVVPLFVCKKCGARFYSMTDSYLKRLIENNISLFEKEEIDQKKKDDAEFVRELQEYIIRIFASKRIHRLKFQGLK